MQRSIKVRIEDRLRLYYRRYFMQDFNSATPETPKAVIRAIGETDVEGDYYEFGLYKGYAFYKAVKASPEIMHFGFDSFIGLPKTNEGGKFVEGKYSSSRSEVEGNLKKRGAFGKNVMLIEGFYKDVLTDDLQSKLLNNKIKVVLIDVDLYESTIPVLRFIRPMIQKGSMILFDDWNCFNADDTKGERRAFAEFLESNKDIKVEKSFSFGWHGQAFKVVSI